MDYKVLIAPHARDDLKIIVHFIARENPNAALNLGKLLIEKALSLQTLPLRGRIVPELDEPAIRELIFRSYRIIYQISETNRSIAILRFWHAARGAPEIS